MGCNDKISYTKSICQLSREKTRDPELSCAQAEGINSHGIVATQQGCFLRILQRLGILVALDVRGGSVGEGNMLGRAVVRKLQRAVVAGNSFSERPSPPVQNPFGHKFRASCSRVYKLFESVHALFLWS